MTNSEIKADNRLQRIYGITLAEYNKRLADQGGVCAICGRPPKKVRLNVDHSHAFDKAAITITKIGQKWWRAFAIDPHGMSHTGLGGSRAEARKRVKQSLRRASIRGLLCYQCNKGLAYYRDNPERMKRAAYYLERFEMGPTHEKIPAGVPSDMVMSPEYLPTATGTCTPVLPPQNP